MVSLVEQELLTLWSKIDRSCFTGISGVRVVHLVNLHAFSSLVPRCNVRYDLSMHTMLYTSFLLFVLSGFLIFLWYCIYLQIHLSNRELHI